MKYLFVVIPLLLIAVAILIDTLIGGHTVALLQPKGLIAQKESGILMMYFTLVVIVASAVFSLAIFLVWRYRDGKDAKYSPDWTGGKLLQFSWWAIPSVIMAVLSVLAWQSTHALDPYKPIRTGVDPIEIEVVALRWKWLFIYPKQDIATVNFVQFPIDTPIDLKLTADAPFNSFWIPQLGGQIYAMTGMSTQHHLIANSLGDFNGSAAEISGKGFSGMKFIARSSTATDFDKWVTQVKASPNTLDMATYDQLAAPSENNQTIFYSSTQAQLYNKIMDKFMPPASMNPSMEGMNP